MSEYAISYLDELIGRNNRTLSNEKTPEFLRRKLMEDNCFFEETVKPIFLVHSDIAMYEVCKDIVRVIARAKWMNCDTLLYVINVNPYAKETKAVGVYSPQQEYGRNIAIGAWSTDVHGREVKVENIDLTASDEVLDIERRFKNATNL